MQKIKRGLGVALSITAATSSLAALAPSAASAATTSTASRVSNSIEGLQQLSKGGRLILRSTPGQAGLLARDVTKSGGKVLHTLGGVDTVVVDVSKSQAKSLTSSNYLTTVSPDAKVITQQATSTTNDVQDYIARNGSLYKMAQFIQADNMWARGYTGAGVDVALIDTGVAPVKGLDSTGKILNGPDISFDSQVSPKLGYDGYGHGTHMASIIAGKDSDATDLTDKTKFVGIAPGARIINVKVGAFDGATDVSQVIAGIDWVVQHKSDPGMNIKVLNLSYGAKSTQSASLDPLSWAAEVAMRNGITVVVAAGNDGTDSTLTSPAYNPNVIAVGAVDQTVLPVHPAAYSSATGDRLPDLYAPGSHVLGLRVPGSFSDVKYPTGRVGNRLMLGSGTSQAAAVVSGAAAILAQAFPNHSPLQIKYALRQSGRDLNDSVENFVQVQKAASVLLNMTAKSSTAGWSTPLSTSGSGSLETARGGVHVYWGPGGAALTGEKDIMGKTWNASAMALAAYKKTAWTNGTFNGAGWSGAGWSGAGWSGAGWSGAGWSGAGWSGAGWSGAGWSGATWTGAGWSGAGWSGAGWSGAGWSGAGWSGQGWLGAVWG